MNNYSYTCKNCKSEVPLPQKEFGKIKKQIFPKFCANCRIVSARQSMRPMKPVRKAKSY